MTQIKRSKDVVFFISGKWYMLSNFAAFRVEWKYVDWMTSEHAYQAAKFDWENELSLNVYYLIRDARSAHDTKKIAHQFEHLVRSDWGQIKLEIMECIVRAKLEQHPYIQRKLLETGNKKIIEDSPTDSFWGRGPDYKGENHLGKIWMKLRDELNKGY